MYLVISQETHVFTMKFHQTVRRIDLFAINASRATPESTRTESTNCSSIFQVCRHPKEYIYIMDKHLSHVISLLLPSDRFAINRIFLRIDGLMQTYRAAEFWINIAQMYRAAESILHARVLKTGFYPGIFLMLF